MILYLLFLLQEFLRNPERYIRLGARPPRGVLLVSLTFEVLVKELTFHEIDIMMVKPEVSLRFEFYMCLFSSYILGPMKQPFSWFIFSQGYLYA